MPLKLGSYKMRVRRRSDTVKRGANHPQHRHRQETLEAKAERHEMSVHFHEAENLMWALGMLAPGHNRRSLRRARAVLLARLIHRVGWEGLAGVA